MAAPGVSHQTEVVAHQLLTRPQRTAAHGLGGMAGAIGVLLPALVYINQLILRVNTLAHSLVVLMMMLPMAISKMVTRCLQIKSK